MESIGLKSDRTSLEDVLRTGFGLSAVKNFAEGLVFLTDGSVTNAKGQVVSNNLSTMTALLKMMSFYPASATAENDVVRLSKRVRDYTNEISASFKQAYIKADAEGRTQLVREANDWNRATAGTALAIPNLSSAMSRANTEAQRTVSQRYLMSASAQNKALARNLRRQFDLDVNDYAGDPGALQDAMSAN
jgi:hypothetical protein